MGHYTEQDYLLKLNDLGNGIERINNSLFLINENISELKEQVKKTNGRVTELEKKEAVSENIRENRKLNCPHYPEISSSVKKKDLYAAFTISTTILGLIFTALAMFVL